VNINNKKIIKVVDKEKGIMQTTTLDERYYSVASKNKDTGLPEYKFYPSITYITSHYPKGKFFQEWLKKVGDESELIKKLAGERGSKIHLAVESLVKGEEVKIDSKFPDRNGHEVELEPDEYDAVFSFSKWWGELIKNSKVEVLASEVVLISEKHEYAGTVDLILKIDGVLWIIDLKTGQNIYEDYKLQLSAYKEAYKEMKKITDNIQLAVLQVGYSRNKNKYKLTEIEDKFSLFLNTYEIFKNESGNKKPLQIEYPLSIKIDV